MPYLPGDSLVGGGGGGLLPLQCVLAPQVTARIKKLISVGKPMNVFNISIFPTGYLSETFIFLSST